MDPIAHTLAGASLAQTGLKKLSPYATACLLIAANLPDIDGVMSLFGRDTSLLHRRGLTHGLLAQILLPWLLVGCIYIYRNIFSKSTEINFKNLLFLAYLGVLSHPALDWLNTYGVRLLMPFDGRWFYGDTLFIIDAWMWLLMGASVFLAYSNSRLSGLLWAGLVLAASSLILATDFVPLASKMIWVVGLFLIAFTRFKSKKVRVDKVAIFCISTFLVYLSFIFITTHHSKDLLEEWVYERYGEQIEDMMMGPVPANPFAREIIIKTQTSYYGLRLDLFSTPQISERFPAQKLPKRDEVIEIALKDESIRGFVNWMRFPVFEVIEQENGHRVIIRDLRYVMPDAEQSPGIGMSEVFVDKQL